MQTQDDIRKWTVILKLPAWMACDECCAADEVRRFYAHGESVEEALADADAQGAALFEWDTDEDGDNYHDPAAEFAPVAIYEGHIFDHYTP